MSVLLFLLLTMTSVLGRDSKVIYGEPVERQPKFFSLFTVVRFPNDNCNGTSGDSGVCYSSFDCGQRGGTKVASCASGFGQCCVFNVGCNKVTSEKLVYFSNPKSPSKDTGPISMCSIRIDAASSDICQVRLDFQDFDLSNPDETTGKCTDMFTIPGRELGINSLCGVNTGQHMYISLQQVFGTSSVNMRFDIITGSSVSWKIKATQIECSDKVPENCLQYFPDSSGTIESFNFQSGSGMYPASLNYAICIKKSTDNCRVKFSATEPKFTINSKSFTNDKGEHDANCDDAASTPKIQDYLRIPQASGQPVIAGKPYYQLFCGDRLTLDQTTQDADVYSYTAGPMVLEFHSDDNDGATASVKDKEIGFKLTYVSC